MRHRQTFNEYLSRFKLFYQDEIEAQLYDLAEGLSEDDSETEDVNFAAMKKAELAEYCRDHNVKGSLSRKTKSDLFALCEDIQETNTDCEKTPNGVRNINELFTQLEAEAINPEKLPQLIERVHHIFADKVDLSFDRD